MFDIHLRIVDDIDVLKSVNVKDFNEEFEHIEGFFQLCIDDYEIGSIYHNEPLHKGEIGGEYIDYWLNKLLDTIIHLSNLGEYVAVYEIETTNRWVEFQRIQEKIKIKVATDSFNHLKKLFITNPYENFDYIDSIEEYIDFCEFKAIVCDAVQEFINQLEKINSALSVTKMLSDLKYKLRIAIK